VRKIDCLVRGTGESSRSLNCDKIESDSKKGRQIKMGRSERERERLLMRKFSKLGPRENRRCPHPGLKV